MEAEARLEHPSEEADVASNSFKKPALEGGQGQRGSWRWMWGQGRMAWPFYLPAFKKVFLDGRGERAAQLLPTHH